MLYTVRTERLLCEQIEFNPLFRWFISLGMACTVWDHSTFSQNRDRLFNQDVARLFCERIQGMAKWVKTGIAEFFNGLSVLLCHKH